MDQEKVIVIDFGGQYNQLVARRVRECNVYCEIYSYRTGIEQIKAMNPKGIILTGGTKQLLRSRLSDLYQRAVRTGNPCTWLVLRRTAYDACNGRKGRESTCQRIW